MRAESRDAHIADPCIHPESCNADYDAATEHGMSLDLLGVARSAADLMEVRGWQQTLVNEVRRRMWDAHPQGAEVQLPVGVGE